MINFEGCKTAISILIGKIILISLKSIGRGATALPGKIALKIQPNLLKIINERCEKIVFITGTNGKTTTNNLIHHILKGSFKNVLSNLKGANMPQGLVSAFLNDFNNNYEWGVFEVDEGSFSEIIDDINPDYVIITNFFRDQLDRYGEIENTVSMVYESLKPVNTTLILNADDPLVSQFKDLDKKSIFYGVKKNLFSSEEEKVVETRFCPSCNNYIDYMHFNYGQLGQYYCNECEFQNPSYDYYITNINYNDYKYCFDINTTNNGTFREVCFDYEGIYNIYNCCGAIAFSCEIGIVPSQIIDKMENFNYKLGRMEKITFNDKTIKITLAKNPIGLSEVVKSISYDERDKAILFILNDNPADGQDVSWIWDAKISKNIKNLKAIYCSGRRAEDIALRIRYADYPKEKIKINDNIRGAISKAIHENVEITYILPTYTAVFKTRDIALELAS